MSIATLKRKTEAKYRNSSVGYPSFSLNGTHRSQGYIGQDTIGRRYMNHITTEDASVLKPSVLGTSGQIATQHRWIRRPASEDNRVSLKPDANQNYLDYQAYQLRIQKMNQKELDQCGIEISTLTEKLKERDIARKNAYDLVTKSIPLRRGQAKIFGANAFNPKTLCNTTKVNQNTICNTTKDLTGESKSQSQHIWKVVTKTMAYEGEPTESYKANSCGGII
jgi:hypothetical protein